MTVLVLLLRRIVRKYHLPRLDMLLALILAATLTHALRLDGARRRWPSLWWRWSASVPRGLPTLHVPTFKFEWLHEMSGSAVAIALLGLFEALAVAKSLAIQTREKLDYNRQCLAEGLANRQRRLLSMHARLRLADSLDDQFQRRRGDALVGRVCRRGDGADRAAVRAAGRDMCRRPRWLEFCSSLPPGWSIGRGCDLRCALRGTTRFSCWRRPRRRCFLSVEFSILVGTMLSFIMYVPRAARLKVTELTVGADRVVRDRQPSDEPCTAMVLFDVEGELVLRRGAGA